MDAFYEEIDTSLGDLFRQPAAFLKNVGFLKGAARSALEWQTHEVALTCPT